MPKYLDHPGLEYYTDWLREEFGSRGWLDTISVLIPVSAWTTNGNGELVAKIENPNLLGENKMDVSVSIDATATSTQANEWVKTSRIYWNAQGDGWVELKCYSGVKPTGILPAVVKMSFYGLVPAKTRINSISQQQIEGLFA